MSARSSSKAAMFVLGCMLLFLVEGCSKVKYPSGKDTVDSFGDGRFQIARLPGRKILVDEETKRTICVSVLKWKQRGDLVYLLTSDIKWQDRGDWVDVQPGSARQFVILNWSSGNFTEFDDLNQVPAEARKVFERLMD